MPQGVVDGLEAVRVHVREGQWRPGARRGNRDGQVGNDVPLPEQDAKRVAVPPGLERLCQLGEADTSLVVDADADLLTSKDAPDVELPPLFESFPQVRELARGVGEQREVANVPF